MNFRGINSIFNSQGLNRSHYLSFPLALKLLRKENQLQIVIIWVNAKILVLKKRSSFYARRISPLPKLLTTKNSKRGAYTPEYTVLAQRTMVMSRGAPDRKIFVRPDNRTGLIEAGYRPDRTLSSIVSDEGLFSQLGNENYEKRSRFLPKSGEKLFSLRHNSMNFDSPSQIQFF